MPPLPTRDRLRLLEAEMLDAEEQGAALLRLVGGTLARAKGVASSPCHFSWLEACSAYRAFTHAAAERLVSEGKQRESEAVRSAAEKVLERERERVAADKARLAAEKEGLVKAAEEKEARTKAEAVKAAAAAAKREREEAALAKEKERAVAAAAAAAAAGEVARVAALKEKEREAEAAAEAEAEVARLAALQAEADSLRAAETPDNESEVEEELEEEEEEEEEVDAPVVGPPPPSFLSPASLPLPADNEEEEADISDGELAQEENEALESDEEELSMGSDLDLEALDVPIGSDFPSLPYTTTISPLPTAAAAESIYADAEAAADDDDPPLAEGMPNDPFLAAAWIAAKRRQGRKSGVFDGGASKVTLNSSKASVFDGSATSSILASSAAAVPSSKAAAFEGGASRSFFGGSSRPPVVKTGLQPMDAPTTILSSPPPALPKSYMHDSPPIPLMAASSQEDTLPPHVDSPGQSMSLNDIGGKGRVEEEEEEEVEEDGGGFSWPGALGGGLLGGFSLSHSVAPRPRASTAVASKPAVPTPLAFRAQHKQAVNSLDSDEEDEDFGGVVFGGGGGNGVKAGGRDSPDTPDSAPPSPDMDKIEEFAFGSTWGGGGAKKMGQPKFQGGVTTSFTTAPSKAPPPPPPSRPVVSSWSTVGGEVDATDL